MKKIIFVALVLCAVLFSTNPSKIEYNYWLQNMYSENSDNFIEEGLIELIGDKVIDKTTKHTNYHLFTVFETDLSDVGIEPFKAIGILNTFFPMPEETDANSVVLLFMIMFTIIAVVYYTIVSIVKKIKRKSDIEF
jgi:hypothetical protein